VPFGPVLLWGGLAFSSSDFFPNIPMIKEVKYFTRQINFNGIKMLT
jgi:hypothetical protein